MLVFVEEQAHVEALGGLSGEPIALSSEAEFALLQRGLAYQAPDAFFRDEETRALKEETLARVREFCAELDRRAAPLFPDLKGFEPFRAHLFTVRHLFDHAAYTVWRLRRVLAARPGRPVSYFRTVDEPLDEGLFFRRESIWSRLIPLVCAAEGVECRALPAPPAASGRKPLAERLTLGLKGAARAALTAWPKAAVRGEPGEVLFLNPRYSVGLLERAWLAEGRPASALRLDRLPCPVSAKDRRALARLWDEARREGGPAGWTRFGGVDVRAVLEPRLEYLFTTMAPRAAGLRRQLARRLRGRKPAAAVAATINWREKVASGLFRELGTPFVCYLHGAIGTRHSEIVGYNDLDWSDEYWVYGEAHRRYCESAFPGARGRPVVVGSAALDAMKAALSPEKAAALKRELGLKPGRKTVIYPLAAVRDFRFPQYHRSDSANFRVQRELIELFARFPDVDFLVKLYDGDFKPSPITRHIRARAHPNVHPLRQPPFSELLGLGDAFIISFPSTTLAEMALTDKPIVFVDALQSLDWLPEALAGAKARTEYCATMAEAEAALERVVLGSWKGKDDGGRYVRDYGTYLGDGKSLQRALAELARITNAGVRPPR